MFKVKDVINIFKCLKYYSERLRACFNCVALISHKQEESLTTYRMMLQNGLMYTHNSGACAFIFSLYV